MMYTQCPECLTYFQVSPEHLKIAQGNVRCGQCSNVFSALGNLSENPPDALSSTNSSTDILDDDFSEFDASFDSAIASQTGDFDFDNISFDISDSTAEENPSNKFDKSQRSNNLSKAIENIKALNQSSRILQSLSDGKAKNIEKLKKTKQAITATTSKLKSKKQSAKKPLHSDHIDINVEKFNSARTAKATSNIQRRTDIAIVNDDEDIDIEQAFQDIDNLDLNDDESMSAFTDDIVTNDDTDFFIENRPAPAPHKEKVPESIPAPVSQPARQQNRYPRVDVNSSQNNLPKAPRHTKTVTNPPQRESALDSSANLAKPAVEKLNQSQPNAAKMKNGVSKPSILGAQSAKPTATHPGIKAVDLNSTDIESTVIMPRPQNIRTAVVNKAKAKSKLLRRSMASAKPRPPKQTSTAAGNQAPIKQNTSTNLPALVPTMPSTLLDDIAEQHDHPVDLKNTLIWGAGSLLLMVVFVLQAFYFKHDELAQINSMRPWVESICEKLNCEISLKYDIKRLELLGQDIRTHPKVKNALLVSATIINNASFSQPYPGLQITFSDLNGEKVAMRQFSPQEYLPRKIKIERGMRPDTPVQLELEVIDPGSRAVNFEFDFFKW